MKIKNAYSFIASNLDAIQFYFLKWDKGLFSVFLIVLIVGCSQTDSKRTDQLQLSQIDNQIIIKYISESDFIVTHGNCSEFSTDSDIEYCEPDYIVQTTSNSNHKLSELWGFETTLVTQLWNTLANHDIIIAVIDEGIDIDHPDLSDNIWVNTDEIPDNGIDDDQNGYIDDINGWNFADNSPIVFSSVDGDTHGTHVAGTMSGVIGVNPKAKIMVLKFINPAGGRVSNAAKAIHYALDNGAILSNHSYGGYVFSETLNNAVALTELQNHIVIAAAGNNYYDTNSHPFYPACFNYANIISVAATTKLNSLTFFSNYGVPHIDVAVPGSQIYSTFPNNSYGKLDGTSMAAPLVTGIISLIKALYPDLTGAELRQRLIDSSTPQILLQNKVNSGGVVNAQAFLELNEQLSDNDIIID